MVQLQEIVDEHFEESQPGPEEDDADYTDTDSEISEESEYDPRDESLGERLFALRDIVSPQTRGYITNTISAAGNAVMATLHFSGRTFWIISSSALLLGIPWALAWSEEQQMLEMEKEMKMREVGGDLLTAGTHDSSTAQQLGNALGQETKPAL
ncbi:mitochondrial outer membrane translocase complex, subunit Tom22 [Hypoxylon argillaceum]|nr:mitochondrial outer membrane translocase complex, subunit Tom22 [Hypoxylon argillaceum]KAI1155009.1 mitochondrial outer membrane translocase complex, subunit Tom22 [Nemania diffusa]